MAAAFGARPQAPGRHLTAALQLARGRADRH